MDILATLTEEFSLRQAQVEAVVNLIDEGNTIPFIARYRKEVHGGMDDQTLRSLSERLEYLRGLEKQREDVKERIEAAGALTPELLSALEKAATLAEIEDIYRPYRPKRRTRATIAKEKGLEPLAAALWEQGNGDPLEMAAAYVDEEKEVTAPEEALSGALDILAEQISDDASLRRRLRVVAFAQAELVAKAVDPEAETVYKMYYDFRQPVRTAAGHRVLAVNRGEKEEALKVSVEFDREKALSIVYSASVKQPCEKNACSEAVRQAAEDSYDRLIFPSLEREIRASLTENASEAAIKVFSVNLRQLLMQPPVKGKTALGLDPGYRTGCKVAVVDETGRVLDTGVIYPTHSGRKVEEAKEFLSGLIRKYKVQIIAIGNGTASRETEQFTAGVIAGLKEEGAEFLPAYAMVSEAGASVYSASPLAAKEFPQFDLTLRSAVSIARRLQDPLAELVKIDPKAIGVGQYQHDMPQKRLNEALSGVVEDCVNSVGVDLNTASPSLLEKVSGLSQAVSKNIVAYREENGAFKSRAELKKVPKLGPKAFEQCAGFLRVPESAEMLDHTAVHPESYSAAKGLLKLCGYSAEDLRENRISGLPERLSAFGEEKAAQELGTGVPTLKDIVSELLKPGRDPRDELPPVLLRSDVLSADDLKVGMELSGTVRNVTDFGAFVDIGVHQDGLVHISQICKKFIRHPGEVLHVGDVVRVKVLSVENNGKRIGLSMRDVPQNTNLQ